MKKVLIALILVLTLFLVACAPTPTPTPPPAADDAADNGDEVPPEGDGQRPVIVMGTNAGFEPFEFIADYGQGRHGEFSGIDVAIAVRIAEHIGADLEIYDTEFASLIMELQTGRIDFIAAAMTIRPDRQEMANFSDPYFTATQYIIVPIDNDSVSSVQDLDGLIVGVQLGTTGDIFVTENVEAESVARYNRVTEAVLDLMGGSIDAVVVDSAVAQLVVARYSDRLSIVRDDQAFAQEFYGIAVHLDNLELLEQINEVIREMTEAGEIEALFVYYAAYLAD